PRGGGRTGAGRAPIHALRRCAARPAPRLPRRGATGARGAAVRALLRCPARPGHRGGARRVPRSHGGGARERRSGDADAPEPGGGRARPAARGRRVKREPLFWKGAAPLVLASASPRRVALLRQVGAAFTVVDPGPDREWPGLAAPRSGVRALA